MKIIIKIIFLFILSINADAQLLINEAVTNTSEDWVELFFYSNEKEKLEISKLYVTMYYGTNEPLGKEPITIYSYDRPETPYDDRFIVVHLSSPSTRDETDLTGDSNHNGYIDVYCNNYFASLWNTDCVVAIDTDDDPSNGGIIDFIAYSSMDGSPNDNIAKYIQQAQKHGQWEKSDDTNYQNISIYTGEKGLESYMSISRINSNDTNTKDDFAISNFQTPGKKNITGYNKSTDKLFKLYRKKISIVPSDRELGKGHIPVVIYNICSIKLQIFTSTGISVYKSPLYRSVNPGKFNFRWESPHKNPTGFYIGKIEAVNSQKKISNSEYVYLILSHKK